MTDHDREKAAFWKRYKLGDPNMVPIIIAIAFNEGWLRGRKALRTKRRRRTAK